MNSFLTTNYNTFTNALKWSVNSQISPQRILKINAFKLSVLHHIPFYFDIPDEQFYNSSDASTE